MEDFQTQEAQALTAHVEGLEAALEALPTEPETGASLRRIARSLYAIATRMERRKLADTAERVHGADVDGLAPAAEALLHELRATLGTDEDGELAHVLLVEDNRTVAAAIRAYLTTTGTVVHHAADAATAERLLADQPISLVLLDLILPDRDGRDLLIQMRERRATADIPVLVLSAKEGAVARAECLAVGAAEFLEKPVAPKALRTAVARHLHPRRPPQATCVGPVVPGRAALVEAYEPIRVDGGGGAAVALLSLNELGRIAEALGDEASDRLLERLAGPIGASLEGPEMLGRWGRGELLMLLPGATAADAKTKLRAGLAELAASDVLAECVVPGVDVSFSAGVAVATGPEDLRDVVSAAEASLYRARSAGHGVVVTPDDAAPERPSRVMLVEDDRVTATLIHHRLVREGFEVMDFLNGEEAYEWAADASFELAILDVKVPGMDGFELLERLRAIRRLDDVPIVMLTGLGSETDVIRGLELGANDYMLKPFSPTELLARVRRLVYGGAGGTSDAGGPRGARAGVAAR